MAKAPTLAAAPAEEVIAPAPAAPASDGKVEVETTGDFMLIDITTGAEIEAFGPTRVTNSAFVQTAIADGKLKLVS